jgi:hypothetical protein
MNPLYLNLMKECLLGTLYRDGSTHPFVPREFDETLRDEGKDWPAVAHTMVGRRRLDNVQFCVEDVLARGIRGDLVETGVWRGGVCIFMRAILKAHGVKNRRVWVCDSFEGLPPPNAKKYPADKGLNLNKYKQLAVSLEEVSDNFRHYGLLDRQVRFLKGWFRDTLPKAPVKRIAVLRLDGDLYESTMDALTHLYPRLAKGGYIIIDDYNEIRACRRAVTDYRKTRGIVDRIIKADSSGVYWKKRG